MSQLILAFDTSSPTVTVAVALGGDLLALRAGGQRESSARLLPWVDEALGEAGARLAEVAGIVALAGPGSFTGLRVGLATALGLHQALGLPATAIPTLAVLAAAAPPGRRVLSLVGALPGEWFAQAWGSDWPPVALDEPRRRTTGELASLAAAAGVDLLVAAEGVDLAAPAGATGLASHTAGPLAGVAARLTSRHPPSWDVATLTAPLYLAPAPATLPAVSKRVLPLVPRDGR